MVIFFCFSSIFLNYLFKDAIIISKCVLPCVSGTEIVGLLGLKAVDKMLEFKRTLINIPKKGESICQTVKWLVFGRTLISQSSQFFVEETYTCVALDFSLLSHSPFPRVSEFGRKSLECLLNLFCIWFGILLSAERASLSLLFFKTNSTRRTGSASRCRGLLVPCITSD